MITGLNPRRAAFTHGQRGERKAAGQPFAQGHHVSMNGTLALLAGKQTASATHAGLDLIDNQ